MIRERSFKHEQRRRVAVEKKKASMDLAAEAEEAEVVRKLHKDEDVIEPIVTHYNSES